MITARRCTYLQTIDGLVGRTSLDDIPFVVLLGSGFMAMTASVMVSDQHFSMAGLSVQTAATEVQWCVSPTNILLTDCRRSLARRGEPQLCPRYTPLSHFWGVQMKQREADHEPSCSALWMHLLLEVLCLCADAWPEMHMGVI